MIRSGSNYEPQQLVDGTPIALGINGNRSYLCVIPTADTTITFSNGVGFTLSPGTIWEPCPAPINELSIEGAGVVITG